MVDTINASPTCKLAEKVDLRMKTQIAGKKKRPFTGILTFHHFSDV
ncbi:hypothetical protein FLA_1380 [Filimonas lacunae]|nr:hypothetical protein FLA_1380 [Filimonas lacunae]